MKKHNIFTVTALILVLSTSAFAHRGGGHYHGRGHSEADDVLSAYSAVLTTQGLFLSTIADAHRYKVIVDAKEDAAIYLATKGEVMGPSLQVALESIRSENQQLKVTDLELAESIVNF